MFLIKLYQWTISPVIGSSCRFQPTCSQYAFEAVQKHGFFKGFWLMIKRLSRCNGYFEGGKDPVP